MAAWMRGAIAAVVLVLAATAGVQGHDGPPFPIVSSQPAGPYVVSVWTDPDTTDDGTAGGQFWVMAKTTGADGDLPPETRATVTIWPLDRDGETHSGVTEPVDGDVGRQFVALVMDHEGRFAVRVSLDGPLGVAAVEADVDATYDTRPPPAMLFLYLAPFVLVGGLWMRALMRRPRSPTPDRH